MMELRVWGGDDLWSAQVVKPERGPEVAGRRADHAVLKALTAWRRHQEQPAKCERCGHTWRLRGDRTRVPAKCPKCNRPPRWPELVRLGLKEPRAK